MMTNVIDTEKLGSYIVELKNLHTEWAAKNVVMPDVGECGGSTIIQIEEMGKQYQKRFPTWNREKVRLRRKKRHIQKHFLHRKKKKAWG